MVSGGGRGGRGGGRVGGAGSARKLTAEELEHQRRASDAARKCGSYRFLHHGPKPPRHHAFTEGSSSSASPPLPRFDPGDYAEDDDIPALAAKLEMDAPALMAGDFVPDAALGTVTALLEEKSRRDAEKKAEWLREQAAQDACYIELDSD